MYLYMMWCRLIRFSKIFGSIKWELESLVTELWYSDMCELDTYRRWVKHTIVTTMNIQQQQAWFFLILVIQGGAADIVTIGRDH